MPSRSAPAADCERHGQLDPMKSHEKRPTTFPKERTDGRARGQGWWLSPLRGGWRGEALTGGGAARAWACGSTESAPARPGQGVRALFFFLTHTPRVASCVHSRRYFPFCLLRRASASKKCSFMMPIGQSESDARALQSPAAQAHSPARTPQTQLAHAVAPQAARSAPTSGFALRYGSH